MNPILDDAKHWRDRATEARQLADDMHDELSRETMLKIADEYDKLAERAVQRAIKKAAPGGAA